MKKEILLVILIIPLISIAIAQNCTDSDNGINVFEKGNMIDYNLGYNYTDYCLGSDKLVEFYCDPGYHYVYEYCSDYDTVCEKGRCINKTQPTKSQICVDTDMTSEYPKGENYYTKGTLTSPDRSTSKTDYCTDEPWGAHRANLIEYFCTSNTTSASYGYDCPYGCENGACKTESGTPSTEVICTNSSILGDANNDGKVIYEDYLIIFDIYVGSIQPPSNLCCVDLNKDGKVTREDSNLAYDVYVGNINLGRCDGGGYTPGESCTTSENCPGKINEEGVCKDIPNDNCPVVEEDTNPPIISNILITPEVGSVGTIFTIKARVEDESSLQYVSTNIYIQNDDDNSIRLEMYDDGQHNDEEADDSIYGITWDSAEYEEGVYGYYITTRDASNNDKSTVRYYFVIAETTDLCKEVIPGHNNINEPRANIVFVGINYPDKEFFKDIIEESVDYAGNNQGLLFVEPLKSNKDKFNFWYVDETRYLGHNYWDDWSVSNEERIRLSLMCPLSNKYVIAYYDTFFRPQAFYKDHAQLAFLDVDCSFRQYCDNADLDDDGCVSGQDYLDYSAMTWAKDFEDKSAPDINEDGDINGGDLEIAFLCQQYRVGCSNEYTDCLRTDYFDDFKTYTVHEFGHLFGHLLDEYAEEGVAPFGMPYYGNCFQGTKQECLSNQNDKWYDLLGYGCGEENEIDCVQEPNCQYDANEDGKVTIEDRDVVYDMYIGTIPTSTCISNGKEYLIGDIDNDGIVEYEDYIKVSNVGRLGIVCNDPNDPGCYLEVGCFEGCNYQSEGWFRTTVSNIMRNNFVGPEFFSYGPVNERIFCEEIKDVTGSATGVCNTKYNIK